MFESAAAHYLVPSPRVSTASSSKDDAKELRRRPMLLRLPDEVLDMLASGGDSANGASISLRWEGQGKEEAPTLCIGDQSHPLALKQLETGQQTFIYHADHRSSDSGPSTPSALNLVAPLSYRLSLKSGANVHDAASKRLKDMREEERERKKQSRAVMIEQEEFDKRGRLQGSASTSRQGTPDRGQARTASRVSKNGVGRETPLIRSRSSLATELISRDSRGRSSSPSGLTPGSSPAVHHGVTSMSPAPSSSGPSLRQKILFVLASGPKARRRIVGAIASPEPPILRLLGVLADAPEHLQPTTGKTGEEKASSAQGTGSSAVRKFSGPVNRRVTSGQASKAASSTPVRSASASAQATPTSPSTVYVLRDESYQEVAAAIGAGHWNQHDVPLSEKAKVWRLTRDALERLKLPRNRDEWTWVDMWKDSVKEWEAQEADRTTKDRARREESISSKRTATASGSEDEDAEDDKDRGSLSTPSASPEKAKSSSSSSSARQRLTRAAKGKGPKGELLKREQEKARRKSDRDREKDPEERPEPSKVPESKKQVEADGLPSVNKKRPASPSGERVQKAPPKKRRNSNAEDGEVEEKAEPDRSTLKRRPETEPEAPRTKIAKKGAERQESFKDPHADQQQSERKSKVAKADAPSIARAQHVAEASEGSADREIASSSARPPAKEPLSTQQQQQQQQQHHGPSVSASPRLREPWLDIRSTAEWHRLAERFRRIWQEYEEAGKTLEAEKRRLKKDRERAEKSPINESRKTKSDQSERLKDEAEEGEEVEDEEEEAEVGDISTDRDVRWRSDRTAAAARHGSSRLQQSGNRDEEDMEDTVPISLEELTRLIEEQKARDGELRRMKAVLSRWKASGGS
ncbi:unnamed protein product [Jaminaea pallidilutea]